MLYKFLIALALPFLAQAQNKPLDITIRQEGLLINNYYLQKDNNPSVLLQDVLGKADRELALQQGGRLLVYDDWGLRFRFSDADELLQSSIYLDVDQSQWTPANSFQGKLSIKGRRIDGSLPPKQLWSIFPNQAIYSSKDWSKLAFAFGNLKLAFDYPFNYFANDVDGWSSLKVLHLTWLEEQPPLQNMVYQEGEMFVDGKPAVEKGYLAFKDLDFYKNTVEMREMPELSELAQSFSEDASQGRILFRQLRKLNPSAISVKSLLEDAEDLLTVGNQEALQALLERAVKEHKNSYQLHWALAKARWYKGLDADALKALEEAQKLNPQETPQQQNDYFDLLLLEDELRAQ